MLNTETVRPARRTTARVRPFLTVAEAARKAHVNVATMRVWCDSGAVKAAKIIGRWRIDPADLDDLLTHGRDNPTR